MIFSCILVFASSRFLDECFEFAKNVNFRLDSFPVTKITQMTFCSQLQSQHKWTKQLLVACHKAGQEELDSPNQWPWLLVPGGGGYSTNVYTRRLRPEVQPLTLLYTIFMKKVPLFVYVLLTNGTPFHTPSLELCIPFNCCKSARLSNRNQSQKLNLTFSRLYKALKFICYPFWGPFTDPNDRFPYPFIYIN